MGREGAAERRSVVVIDDSEDDRFFLRRVLGKVAPGAVLHEYQAADEALGDFVDDARFEARFGGASPLVVLDINMPRMSGFEFLERVVPHRGEALAVVVLSASDSPADRACAARYPVIRRTLTKPISRADLLDLLGEP